MTNKLRLAFPILVAIISLGFFGISQAAPGSGGSSEINEVLINYEDGLLTIFGTGFNDGASTNTPSVTLGGKDLSFIDFVDLQAIEVEVDLVNDFPAPGDYLLIVDPNYKKAKTATMMLSLGSVLFNQSCPSDEYMTGIGPKGKIICTTNGGCDPVPEECDGLDNDCDGETDEGCSDLGFGEACFAGSQCASGRCTDGFCESAICPIGAACNADNNGCTQDDTCGPGGTCISGPYVTCSDDGLSCTDEICGSLGANSYQCSTILRADYCVIGGVCYAENTPNPEDSSMSCQPAISQDSWTPVP